MPSSLHAGGIGRQYLNVIGRLRFFVKGGGPTKGEVIVRAHPDDLEEARKAFRPSRLQDALSTTGSALMVTSVFTSSFQGICLAGLVFGRGFDFAKSELIDRAFPVTADRLLFYANLVHDKAVANKVKIGRSKTTVAKSAAGSEKGDKETGGGSGSAAGGSDTGSGSAGGGSDTGSGSVGGGSDTGSGSSGGSDSGSDGGLGGADGSDNGGGLGSALADVGNMFLG